MIPTWTRDGSKLFFHGERTMFAVDVTLEPEFSATQLRELFSFPPAASGYYATDDNERFLMAWPAGAVTGGLGSSGIPVVINWVEELKRLIPTGR